MKPWISCALAVLFTLPLYAGPQAKSYEATWDSLNSRATPQWWVDAKFGIFIHWGVYSVPAYSAPGKYSEWYWYWIRNAQADHPECQKFHETQYGKGFTYADFVPLFKAELFDPDFWADIFFRSGAKYVVHTSKHHDGYTLWRSQEANNSWGRAWNSVDTGPQRDVIGELSAAVRKRGLKMGLYYSLYEWFNPLYLNDVQVFVEKHLFPQFTDMVLQNEPSIIFSDGEWEHGNEVWRSHELLAWLFNESPVKDEVVINDRWYKGSRHKDGGYFTTEYGSGLDTAENPWEENRGIGFSYGFNRAETIDHYSSPQELVLMLVDIVSRGGNLLLDIGPDSDGTIPVIMQDRLLQMGDWLSVNGEAIYESSPWQKTCQWSEGRVPKEERGEYMSGYDILKLTVSPDEGSAVKEIFFTQKTADLYAILPFFPFHSFTIQGLKPDPDTKVFLLGTEREFFFESQGGDMTIIVPPMPVQELPCNFAYTFKITQVIKQAETHNK